MGSHLAEYLLAQEFSVYGLSRGKHGDANIAAFRHRVTMLDGDLTEASSIVAILRDVKPDLIFHLAAQAAVPLAWADPAGTLRDNILGQLNLLQGIITAAIDPLILIPGSNEEYGLIYPHELPVQETNPFRPTNPYGVSKIAQDMMAYQFFLSHKLRCIRVRPFNHIGPRQSEIYVASAFAKQIAEAESDRGEALIKVGNLEVRRDFTDVRDVVRGYHMALSQGQWGEVYNLGSGKAISTHELLNLLLSKSKIAVSVRQDPVLLRPLDNPVSVCDFTKFRRQTGWQPEIPMDRTLEDLLNYWRQRIAHG